jgi:hypothetical protein
MRNLGIVTLGAAFGGRTSASAVWAKAVKFLGAATLRVAAFSCLWFSVIEPASAADWGPVRSQEFVGTGYVHDDEGALFVLCDTNAKLISILLNETRANWTVGTAMQVTTRADTGDEFTAAGKTVGLKQLAVGQEATFSLNTMGKANGFFVIGNGQYARVFPAANFRKAVAPVLAACGDHW